jgi:CubicO group peptidase (beta-lactamase class C family)
MATGRAWVFALTCSATALGGCGGAIMRCTRDYLPADEPERAALIDAYLAKAMEVNAAPGMAVALVKDGRIVYAKAFGVRRSGDDEPVTTRSSFHTASVSKTFVAVAVMQLVEAGKVALDAPATAYLPYFRMKDARHREITVRQLLSHTSGLPDVEDYGWDRPETDAAALERYVRSLADRELLHAPGERWAYSNAGYEVLGDLIAKVSGISFEDYMKTRVLAPVGMHDSSFLLADVPAAERVTGHVGKLFAEPVTHYPYNRAHAPSSTLESSALELAAWVATSLAQGAPDRSRALSPAGYAEMWRKHAEIEGFADVGLGWFLLERCGRRFVAHGGRDPGFASFIGLLPEAGVGAVVLANTALDTGTQLDLARGLLDAAQGIVAEPVASVALPVGRAAFAAGVDAGIAEYRRIQRDEPERYDLGVGELTWVANELYARGRYDDALRIYELEAAEFPGRCHICSMVARTYMRKGDHVRALEWYARWLDYLPTEPDSELEALRANRAR